MEISIKTIVFFLTLLTTGLSSGLFYAWQVSVIPGTRRVTDQSYLESMQQINRAIINPWFMFIFMGALLFLAWSTWFSYQTADRTTFILMLIATLCYAGGTFGVTAAGNVPLNNWLEAINLNELSSLKMVETRAHYEPKWNRLHLIRTIFSVLAFSATLLALLTEYKK
ncbi:DUF1772 domain-containing protein [Roseivirga sp.]|uniref:anthrone oxygenase family protein n=1 Tax=Roseivirga sp. TaxID=1964215 RepID=UPI003B52B230